MLFGLESHISLTERSHLLRGWGGGGIAAIGRAIFQCFQGQLGMVSSPVSKRKKKKKKIFDSIF